MNDRQFHKIAKALSDPRRFSILQTIAEKKEQMCSGEVCETVEVAQATVSHHLKELTEANLIVPHSKGQFKFFTVDLETVSDYILELEKRLKIK